MKNLTNFHWSAIAAFVGIILTQIANCNIKPTTTVDSAVAYRTQVEQLQCVVDSLLLVSPQDSIVYVELPTKVQTKYITRIQTKYEIRDTIVHDTVPHFVNLVDTIEIVKYPIHLELSDPWYSMSINADIDTTTTFLSVRDSIDVGLSVNKRFFNRKWTVDVKSHSPYTSTLGQQTFVFDRRTMRKFK